MFEYDICFCGNADKCPLKDTCKRAIARGPGIYTISNFYDTYKEGLGCDYYWEKKEVNE